MAVLETALRALLFFSVVLGGVVLGGVPAGAATPEGPPPPAVPVPEAVVEQARGQAEGLFGDLARPRTPGQVQEVWDESGVGAAVYVTALCSDCTYKVRTREFMVTVIELPRGEVIEAVDLGAQSGFAVEARGPRRLAVRPSGYGYDTSLLVHGRSGRLYAFYLRAEGFNSQNLPDLVVRIDGAVEVGEAMAVAGMAAKAGEETAGAAPERVAGADRPGVRDIVEGTGRTAPGATPEDFVADVPFDPDALRGWGDYELWGEEALRPETVFRDDHFTYIRFGERWEEVELPTAYVVVDGIDEPVNTRVVGATYIVESTRRLITLKSGRSFLCIRYEGEER